MTDHDHDRTPPRAGRQRPGPVRLLAVIGLAAVLATAASCGSSTTSSSGTSTPATGPGGSSPRVSTGDPKPLSVMMPFANGLNFIADTGAEANGTFAANGLDVDLQFAQSAPAALQQLAAGNVDVIRNAPLSVVKAVSQEGAPFVVIAMPNQETLYRLVSTKDKPIDSLAALEGKKVGMATLGGNAEDTFKLIMKGAGLDPEKVELVATGNDAAALAFVEDGRVDALFATAEATSSMKAQGQDPHIAKLDGLNPLLGTAIVTTRDKLAAKEDLLVAYLRSIDQTTRQALDPTQVDALLAKVAEAYPELAAAKDPAKAKPVVAGVSEAWTAAGADNLLVNVPDRWATGVTGFEKLKIAKEGSDPTSFYTNALIEKAQG